MAPVGAPSPRRAPAIPTAPLPADLRAALSTIAKALRNVPRHAIHDPPELFVWLNRQAKALERARDMPIALTTSPQATRPTSVPLPAPTSPPRALTALERAEAVFRSVADPSTLATGGASPLPSPPGALIPRRNPARPRIVMDRKGRGVRVETRRAREAGQLEMPV